MYDSYSQYLVPSTRLTKMDHFLEDEVIGVEHLLAEPKCNNLGDDVLGFSTFSQETCCNFEEFSTADYGSIKMDCDAQDPNLKLSEKVKEEFLKGMLGRTEAIYLDRKNDLSYTCDDYLLDTEFVDEASDDMNPIKGPYVENSGLENKSTVSGGRGCSDEISELATARIPMLQTLCQDSSLLDEMTIGELHEAFINMFGRETTVTDKQWLRRQLSFGLQNRVVSSSGNEGTISPARDQCFSTVSTHFTGVFNFRKRQRVQHVKRKKHDNHASLKSLSSEDRKAVFGFSELVEKENVLVTSKRSRKPTRRYIEESLEENSRRKKRCEISTACSGDKILPNGSYKQCCHKEFEAKPYVCQKVPFKGACIQVPFGQPVCRGHLKKKVHESDGCKDSLLGSKVDSDTGSFSNKSRDDSSGDDYSSGTLTQKGKSRRKNHMYWSVSEVLKLVEGVSMYGVGRWTEIKKLSFHSSANRTSVDLKDKWRNLLKASYSHLKSNREVELKRKHGSKSTPQSILRRVRELAALYPYPRERKTHVSQTASVASPIPGTSSTCDKLLPE